MSAQTTIVRSGVEGLYNSFTRLFQNSATIQTVRRSLTTVSTAVARNPGRTAAAVGAAGTATLGAVFYDEILTALSGSMTPEQQSELAGAIADARSILCVEDVPCDPDLMKDIRMKQKMFLAIALSGVCERGFLDMKNAIASMCYKDLPLYRQRAGADVIAAIFLSQMLAKASMNVKDSAAAPGAPAAAAPSVATPPGDSTAGPTTAQPPT